MAQRSQVPEFGHWESEENVPYTAYFDNARKGRTGANMNPNDPKDNPDILSDGQPPVQVASFPQEAESKTQKGPESVRARHERQLSWNEGDARRLTDPPLRHDAVGRKATVDSPHHRLSGTSTDSPKRVLRQSVGSDRSIEQSPLHPNHQARLGNKGSGVSSPSWERKGSSEGRDGLAPSTPGRSRLRSVTRGDETPDHSPAVPKFGDWDESDPASAEGYTQVFNRVREEKQSGTGKVPIMPTETSYSNRQKQYGNEDPKRAVYAFHGAENEISSTYTKKNMHGTCILYIVQKAILCIERLFSKRILSTSGSVLRNNRTFDR